MDCMAEAEPDATASDRDDDAEPRARPALRRRLIELEQLDASCLRQEWRRQFRSDPPQLSRDLVLRALAYRLQERELGGLSKSTLRRLDALIREHRAQGGEPPEPSVRIRPGARLVREWRGRTHTVTATAGGFEYAGKTYASLTPIAKTITGAHWSGPRFFGLVRQRPSKPDASSVLPGGSSAASSMQDVQHG